MTARTGSTRETSAEKADREAGGDPPVGVTREEVTAKGVIELCQFRGNHYEAG
jgi:hypothetical protein